ncbi:MAG: hypothetical protein KKC85_04405 [Gammaproteobacteria bacterium]|nr:hypothetical protein [Gammaproteobacteria bacterium]
MSDTPQDPLLVASFALEWEHNDRVLPQLVRYSLAHVLMLVQAGLVPAERGRPLLQALHDLREAGLDEVPFDPALDGLQPSLERVLTAQLGPETAGWLGAGRSRQECELVARQLANRDELLALAGDVLDLRQCLAELAERHADALMPYHTWAQRAEPVTFGYWLAATAEALAADSDRLHAAMDSLGAARSACGQIVPPPWPIDRARVARWLGFDRLAENSLYAYSSLDAELQVLSALASVGNHLARTGTNLHLWASNEFGFLSFSDAMSGTSYAMPQKRNPYALRQLRPLSAALHGAWIDVAQLHGGAVPLVGDGLIHAGNRLMACLPRLRLGVQLLARALPGLRLDTARMAAGCHDDWIVATQLVYGLVGPDGMSFREAHRLMHHLVEPLQQRGEGPAHLTSDDIQRAAASAGLSAEAIERLRQRPPDLKALTDPVAGLHQRSAGGPAPASVREQVQALQQRVGEHREFLHAARERIAEGAASLERALGEVLRRP